ncbi:MAG: hypothetical protein ABFD46_06905 [Armatimonadota bacterium]
MPDTDSAYIKGLLTILKKRDVDALRDFLREEAQARNPEKLEEINYISDEDLEARMYKMILLRQELSDLHADARRWIREHGIEVKFQQRNAE